MNKQQPAMPLRDRIGISIAAPEAPTLVATIVEAEEAGVRQIWMTQTPTTLDTLTVFAAALGRTNSIRLGTSIIPTYPRHPLALAQQAAAVASLAPGRLRLGVGPSHRPAIEGVYGISMESPLDNLAEYVSILQAALNEGTVDHKGHFFTAKATFARSFDVPVLVSALGPAAFRRAGAISDGAISWNCPVSYLIETAMPELHKGAQSAGRKTPPLIAHVWVAMSTDRATVRASARQRLSIYARLPFYANMFATAGYPVVNGMVSDALIDNLVVMGDDDTIKRRLPDILRNGMDELLLTVVPLDDEATERTKLFRLIGQL